MIKFAKPEDVTNLVALGYKSFEENDLAGIGCDPDFNTVLEAMTGFVTNDVVLVDRNEDDQKYINGLLAFTHTSVWWSKEPLLMEVLFYVKPQFRSFKNAVALIKAAKEYSDEQQIPLVMDLFTKKDVEEKRKLLIYCGFKEIGSLYIYHPQAKSDIMDDTKETSVA